MLLAGLTADIGCFINNSPEIAPQTTAFADRFSVLPDLPKLSPSTFSFPTAIGPREAFGNPSVLRDTVAAFRTLLLTPRLFTTGLHFATRRQTLAQLEELAEAGVQQIILRLDEAEARALPSDNVNHLVDGCHANGIDLRLEFELLDTFSDDCCRIARTMEDRQFTVTLVTMRIRPTVTLPLEDAPPLPPKERVQLVLNATGDLLLRRLTPDAVVDIPAGNALDRSLHTLVAAARARL